MSCRIGEDDVRVTVLLGEKILERVKYWVEPRERGPWFWRTKEWFICCEYSSIGPYGSYADARLHLSLVRSVG